MFFRIFVASTAGGIAGFALTGCADKTKEEEESNSDLSVNKLTSKKIKMKKQSLDADKIPLQSDPMPEKFKGKPCYVPLKSQIHTMVCKIGGWKNKMYGVKNNMSTWIAINKNHRVPFDMDKCSKCLKENKCDYAACGTVEVKPKV